MRYRFLATAVCALLVSSSASAALQTRSMDDLRDEVEGRNSALIGDLTKKEKKARRAYTQTLKLFAKDSDSRKTDGKLIDKIVRKLAKSHKYDIAMQQLLLDSVGAFLDELQTDLDGTQKDLAWVPDPDDDKETALQKIEKAQTYIDRAFGEILPKKRLKWCRKAEAWGGKMRKNAEQSIVAFGPLEVHEFEYDILTREYIVKGERAHVDDVQRDLSGNLCSKCHTDAVDDLKSSVHFTVAGKNQRVLFPGGGAHGMLDRACGLPATTGLTNSHSDINLGECAKCHVGRYLPVMEGFFAGMFNQMQMPNPEAQAEGLVNAGLDCLICHAEEYRSRPMEGVLAAVAGTAGPEGNSPNAVGVARDARDNADFDHDGMPDLVLDMDGDGKPDAPLMMDRDGDGKPETPWPTVAQDRSLEALRSIGHTGEHDCLRCHEHARTGYKRGTLFLEGHDVHAAADSGPFAEAENQCTVCHTSEHHKFVRGAMVGGDLMASDYPVPAAGSEQDPSDPLDLMCETCHDASSLPNPAIHREKHLASIACETCHIPYGSGITYSLFGHGGQVSFARNADGKDTKLVVADMYVAENRADIDMDYEAFKTRPIYSWFDGGVSFLAQPLTVRGMPNAKITPFKPMANGMVFDARYFRGDTVKNAAGADYNAYSMYRFFANEQNAEAFAGLGMLDMTPDQVRNVTLADFQNPDPNYQAMALMQIFPNLVYFDKANFGYEHYLTASNSMHDKNHDGVIDVGEDFLFDMFAASNSGLQQFMGFNGPMGFLPNYQWYPMFEDVSEVISMKLPDGSLIKMFMQMKAQQMPPEQQGPFLAAVDNYPAFSQITLGGHGVAPKEEALGNDCMDCHGSDGALAHTVPVGRKVPVNMGPQMGTLEMPVYKWKYYNMKALVDLGLTTNSEEIVAKTTDVDIDGNAAYLRVSGAEIVLNWFMPNAPNGYRRPDDATALQDTGLTADQLTWNGGDWMPVLEPVTDLVENYKVLGFQEAELIW